MPCWRAADKWNGTDWLKIFGSLGDTLNDVRISTFDNDQNPSATPFNSNMATVLASDANVFADIEAKLLALGVTAVNKIQIPAGGWGPTLPVPLSMGLEDEKNLFTMLLRIGVVANAAERNAYLASTPFSVVRVSRTATAPARAPALFTPASIIPRDTTNDELTLDPALAALVQGVQATYAADYNIQVVPTVPNLLGANVDFGGVCYVLNLQCSGDNRDALYAGTQPTVVFTRPSDISIVVGVNHRATGMATYSNLVIYNGARQVGVVGVNDDDYAGSADAFLDGTAFEGVSDKLYAYTFARNCTGRGPYCAEVPSTGYPFLPNYDPSTPALSAGLFIDRAYVHPETEVGPKNGTVLSPFHLRLSLRPCPLLQPCQNGGICTDNRTAYTCECAPGFTGTNCETRIEPLFCDSADTREAFVDEVAELLEAEEEYVVQKGAFNFFNVAQCQLAQTCFFQNADGPWSQCIALECRLCLVLTPARTSGRARGMLQSPTATLCCRPAPTSRTTAASPPRRRWPPTARGASPPTRPSSSSAARRPTPATLASPATSSVRRRNGVVES